jgi:delta(3,5)-delta(2,4)-dienoyl-CoA isomerase
MDMATMIAAKSPVAVQGTKMNLVNSREHSVEEGLEEVAKWNMTMLQSENLTKSAMAAMDKTNTEPTEFADF